MFDDGKKSGDAQLKRDGRPGEGPIEWTGEPRPDGEPLDLTTAPGNSPGIANDSTPAVPAAPAAPTVSATQSPKPVVPGTDRGEILMPRSGLVSSRRARNDAVAPTTPSEPSEAAAPDEPDAPPTALAPDAILAPSEPPTAPAPPAPDEPQDQADAAARVDETALAATPTPAVVPTRRDPVAPPGPPLVRPVQPTVAPVARPASQSIWTAPMPPGAPPPVVAETAAATEPAVAAAEHAVVPAETVVPEPSIFEESASELAPLAAEPAPLAAAATPPNPAAAAVPRLAASGLWRMPNQPTPAHFPGAAAIGGIRPWATARGSSKPVRAAGSPRKMLAIGGSVILVAALVVGAVAIAVNTSSGGSPNRSGANGGIGNATATPTDTATPTPIPTLTPTPTVPAGPITAATTLTPDRGSVVSIDNFQDARSGWPGPSSKTSTTTYQFQASGYVIHSLAGTMEHFVYAPYRSAKPQLSMSITASLTGAPSGAGVGVTCRRGTGATQTSYALVVLNTGKYYVERYDGVPGAASNPVIVKKGTSASKSGAASTTVVGMCIDLGGATERLVLFVEGQEIADVTDVATIITGSGWAGGFVMVSGKTPSSLTATGWVERDLSK